MKYRIGDIVKYDSINTWLVVATKENPLTIKYLDELSGEIKVKDIMEMASRKIIVNPGFDYVIKKILSYEFDLAVLDIQNENCFEEDIWL
jgi:hypothetical protein